MRNTNITPDSLKELADLFFVNGGIVGGLFALGGTHAFIVSIVQKIACKNINNTETLFNSETLKALSSCAGLGGCLMFTLAASTIFFSPLIQPSTSFPIFLGLLALSGIVGSFPKFIDNLPSQYLKNAFNKPIDTSYNFLTLGIVLGSSYFVFSSTKFFKPDNKELSYLTGGITLALVSTLLYTATSKDI